MSREEFWDESPYLCVSYREARKLQAEKENGDAWWLGAYIRQSVLSALSASMPWFKKPIDYPKNPYRITPYSEAEKEAMKQKERDKAIKSLNAWKEAWDKQHG